MLSSKEDCTGLHLSTKESGMAKAALAMLVFCLWAPALEAQSAELRRAPGNLDEVIPRQISGVEITELRGPLSMIYPWEYFPEISTVHPVPELWTARRRQSPFQLMEQERQLEAYGFGGDILSYNPAPGTPDHNHWAATYFKGCKSQGRPFFLLYEHVKDGVFVGEGDRFDMGHQWNRHVFLADIEWMVREVILPCRSRYITWNNKAVIYLWSVKQMGGDFASLLNEARRLYPVVFIGSINLMDESAPIKENRNFRALNGFLEYSLVPPVRPGHTEASYVEMSSIYEERARLLRSAITEWQQAEKRPYLFIPTFQARFDESKLRDRRGIKMYPKSRAEVEKHARFIWEGMYAKDGPNARVFDPIGPAVVYSEFPEGASVIESLCAPETADRPGKFYGCGVALLELLRSFFAPWAAPSLD